ncbi:unnamed protein product [Discula destructiva]
MSQQQNKHNMRLEEMSPHLHFLGDAAHLLAQTAPQTSAFLMRRRNEVLRRNDVPLSHAQRQYACSACGHIMLPGQGNDTLEVRTDKVSKTRKLSRSRKAAANPRTTPPAQPRATPRGTSKVMSCGSCFKKTVLKLEGPGRISRSQKVTQQSKVLKESGPQAAPEPKSASASSKKRAKNRKAGLQALLDQKQGSASSSGFGLSLSDFMQK